jgi:hypothetical protein
VLGVLEGVLQPLGAEGGRETMNGSTAAFLRLESMVHQAEASVPIRTRTEAEEDRIALECLILENDGPDALEIYQLRRSA